MHIPIQITIRDIEHSEALETHIHAKANKLDEFFDHIMSCRVVVEMPHKHQHQGKQFNVRIDLGVAGGEIVVNHDHAEDVYVALRDAFDAAKRQLEDYVRKLRGDVKKHQPKRVNESEDTTADQQPVDISRLP
ncbi:MAG: ribosome-associated translation inhibitor RaiA [Sideroxyarcus sp.]|nr:ribosome-associated translation inhibitor RaiA [Sideroxyarcus sp.]